MAAKYQFKPSQLILVKYYDYDNEYVLSHQSTQWYNGNWEHTFVQILPAATDTAVIIHDWEVDCGLVKILEDGKVLKVLYGQDSSDKK